MLFSLNSGWSVLFGVNSMEYGRLLIDAAAKVCGSRYALAKRLGLNESNLAQVYAGRRKMPVEWVGPMAVIAGFEPGEATLRVLAERGAGKPPLAGMAAAAAGGVATLLFSYASSVSQRPEILSALTACVDCLRIVSTTGRRLFIRARSARVVVRTLRHA